MNNKKGLDKITIIFVVLLGTGFGTVAGLAFLEHLFLIGTLLSIGGSFFVAKLYLRLLPKIFAKKYSSARYVKIFSLGTLSGMLCGVICTSFIYGVMALVPVELGKEGFRSLAGGPFIMLYGEVTGAVAGLVAGALCTALYMWKTFDRKTESDEINELP
jgi:hypothetical protein